MALIHWAVKPALTVSSWTEPLFRPESPIS